MRDTRQIPLAHQLRRQATSLRRSFASRGKGAMAMIMTDAGFDTLAGWRSRVFSGFEFLSAMRRLATAAMPARQGPGVWEVPVRQVGSVATEAGPADLEDNMTTIDGLTVQEQKARIVALRGLSQARGGDVDTARATFIEAIRLDPNLDLRRLPAFWKLSRPAHDAVVDALLETDRRRDAASLIADLRTKFRPRLIPDRLGR